MKNGYQTICEKVGKWGCYALSLIHVAQSAGAEAGDPVSAVWRGMEKGLIDKSDCTVLDPAEFLALVSGKKWRIVVENGTHRLPPGRKCKSGEYVVKEWFNPRTNFTHFATDGYDGLVSSMTVKEGYVRSLRVFKIC